jgi:hypothetical protein
MAMILQVPQQQLELIVGHAGSSKQNRPIKELGAGRPGPSLGGDARSRQGGLSRFTRRLSDFGHA